MKLAINTEIYNDKRYGKPYIGIVNAADGKVARWGSWIGTPGNTGLLEIEVAPGDIIIRGQKDNRGNNGTPDYGVVQASGAVEYMGKAEAVKAAREAQKTAAGQALTDPTLSDLLEALGVTTTREALARIRTLTQQA